MLTQEFRSNKAYEEMRDALAGVRTQMGALSFAMPQDVATVQALVERVLEAIGEATKVMERQMQAERSARAEQERAMHAERAQMSAKLQAAMDDLAEARVELGVERAARERAERRPEPKQQSTPAPLRLEPTDYKLKRDIGFAVPRSVCSGSTIHS